VERIGNLNYPDEARRKNLSGSLILAVGVNQDAASIASRCANLPESRFLDNAAQRIVQMAAAVRAISGGIEAGSGCIGDYANLAFFCRQSSGNRTLKVSRLQALATRPIANTMDRDNPKILPITSSSAMPE